MINRRGLVGHWAYHGNVAALGTSYDLSGGGNHGTLVGNAFVNNQGINLDGSGDYVNVANESNFDISTLTILAWIYANYTSGCPCVISKFGNVSPYSGYEMLIGGSASNKLALNVNIDGAYYGMYGSQSLSTNNWIHVAISYNGEVAKFYIDGNEDSCASGNCSVSGAITTNNYSLEFGRWTSLSTNYFNGNINDARIYNRALSAEEIKQIYHNTKGRHI